jgi:hypothetical protein
MSNITDSLLINESTTTSNTNSISEQTNKDKPSLFDSLLSNISTTEEIKVINANVAKSEVKEITTNIEEITSVSNIELVDNIDVKDLESIKVDEENKEQKLSTSTGSLLDKLVLEAKKSVKNIDTIDKESTKLDPKIENNISGVTNESILNSELSTSVEIEKIDIKIENNSIPNTDIKETKNLDITKKEEIVVNSEMQNREELKASSLLDRLVIEAKKDDKSIVVPSEIKEVSEVDSKVESKSPIIDKESLVVEDKKIEELGLSNNILKEEEIKITQTDSLEKINTLETILPVIVKENKNLSVNDVTSNTIPKEKIVDKIILDNSQLEDATKKSQIISLDETTVPNLSVINFPEEKVLNNELLNLESTNKSLNTNVIPITITSDEAISIEDKTNTVTVKKDENLSLMDQLIQKNSEKLKLDVIGNNEFDSSLKEVITKDLISSIYLGSQKNKINSQSLFNKNEAISLLKDGNSIQAVKTSAEILDLGLEEISLDQSLIIDKTELKQLNRKSLIENLLLEKNVKTEEIKNLITKSVDASNALIENSINLANDVTINVNSPISYNIQSKIIGAKQQMSAMMSDIAKQMYENYKPPVTAFKINLNPTELGSIAILMKSDKNSGLSISMSVSNNVTLETLIENQNVLKNSLNKTFDEGTKFNLDFGSSNQNDGNQSSSNSQSNRQFEQQMGTQAVLQLKEENKEIEEKIIDYM